MTAGAIQEVRRHPVAEAVARLHAELDAVAESSVWSMSHEEFTETLTGLTRLAARVAELELRVAARAPSAARWAPTWVPPPPAGGRTARG